MIFIVGLLIGRVRLVKYFAGIWDWFLGSGSLVSADRYGCELSCAGVGEFAVDIVMCCAEDL